MAKKELTINAFERRVREDLAEKERLGKILKAKELKKQKEVTLQQVERDRLLYNVLEHGGELDSPKIDSTYFGGASVHFSIKEMLRKKNSAQEK